MSQDALVEGYKIKGGPAQKLRGGKGHPNHLYAVTHAYFLRTIADIYVNEGKIFLHFQRLRVQIGILVPKWLNPQA